LRLGLALDERAAHTLLPEIDGENEPDRACADDENLRIDRLIIILRMRGIVALAAAFACGIAWAQDFPARTVHLIVPYTPGTGADILARLLGARLAERWKVGVVTENKPGATGNIGAAFVAKSAPDGYTLLFVATSFGTTPALGSLPFDPVRSFAPVALAATSALVFVVNPQLSVRSMRELIELAKRTPGKLHYSSPGNGGPQHLAMELLKLELGMDIVHVPYKTAAGALNDVVGGHVQATIAAVQTAHPQVTTGQLRALAVLSAERSKAFVEVPTLREQGLPGLEVETWYGAFAPAGTPASVVARINGDLDSLLKDPGVREFLARQGMAAIGGPPERLGDLVKRELERWSRVVKAAGIKAD
jgi:tripartite-type tricarboxylate transporter receptor subunit TctC